MVETAALLCAFSGTLLLLMPWIDEISKGYVKSTKMLFHSISKPCSRSQREKAAENK